jgi:UDPglucose--hexose-1-phosphate uridylyltransferase
MPELRKDPVTGRWVIIATERVRRPSDYLVESSPPRGGVCPFCPGNEAETPPEIEAFGEEGRSPNSPGWWLRVVPNKFPALRVEGDLRRTGKGIYDLMNGVGAHEVIVETPVHDQELADLSDSSIEKVIWAYRDRMMDLKKDNRLLYALVFKNHGDAAGASLEHPHSQIIATPIIPKRVQEELKGARQYYDYRERCIFCDMLQQELKERERLIFENASFAAVAPFASRFPFETWIMPKAHQADFLHIGKQAAIDLARVMKEVLVRLKRVLNDPPYNYMLHTLPLQETDQDAYHWHIEIIPKLTKVAGFEWGSGFYINPTPPEEAATALREPV